MKTKICCKKYPKVKDMRDGTYYCYPHGYTIAPEYRGYIIRVRVL